MIKAIYVLEFIGIIAFAISGFQAARKLEMDPVGYFFIACVTAFGGGTARDLILDRTPVYWIQHQEFPIMILILALLFAYIKPLAKIKLFGDDAKILIPDAIGLAIFSVLGTNLALTEGSGAFIAVILGVMTGTVGGILRDVLCNEIPYLFRKLQLYATCAFVGCFLYVVCLKFSLDENLALWISFLFTAILRLLAMRKDWRLQQPERQE